MEIDFTFVFSNGSYKHDLSFIWLVINHEGRMLEHAKVNSISQIISVFQHFVSIFAIQLTVASVTIMLLYNNLQTSFLVFDTEMIIFITSFLLLLNSVC